MKKFIAFLSLSILALLVRAADVELTWAASPAADQVKNYFVYQSTAGGGFIKVATVGTNTTHTVSNLVAGLYQFHIRAASAWGVESDPSAVLSTPPGQPGQVQQVQAWLIVGLGSSNRFNLSTGQ